jgi:hypothetical protein
VQAQLPQEAAPSATTTAPAAASSSKKSSKKAAKSAKKQAKQQPNQPSSVASTLVTLPSTPATFRGKALEWAATVVGLALCQEEMLAAVLDGWQLLDWLEVRGLLLMWPGAIWQAPLDRVSTEFRLDLWGQLRGCNNSGWSSL